jgi:hypothetical protein
MPYVRHVTRRSAVEHSLPLALPPPGHHAAAHLPPPPLGGHGRRPGPSCLVAIITGGVGQYNQNRPEV